MQSSDIP